MRHLLRLMLGLWLFDVLFGNTDQTAQAQARRSYTPEEPDLWEGVTYETPDFEDCDERERF